MQTADLPVEPPRPRTTATRPVDRTWARLCGVLAAAVALGLDQFLSALADGWQSLVVSVANEVKDKAPTSVTTWGIETFGTNDKPLLIAGTVVICLGVGALVGPPSARRPWIGGIAFGGFAVLGAGAGVTDASASDAGSVITAVVAAAAGFGTLILLLARAPRAEGPRAATEAEPIVTEYPTNPGADRRTFFTWAGAAGVVALGSWGLARRLRGPSQAAIERQEVTLVNSPGPSGLPTGLEDQIDGISPLVTPNADFYRIDTALLVPDVVAADWELKISGMVDQPYSLSFDELLEMATDDFDVTLSCVSNEVGGNLVGNARWTGVPLAAVLDRAGVQPGATQVVGHSVDGWTAGFPTEVVYDGRPAIIAVGMNGEPLPIDHGYPARLVVAGLYGYVSATKWLAEIELTTWEDFDGYWIPRGWSKQGPIKTQSRIDVPRANAGLAPGNHPIAGVAWAGERAISRVEVQVDDGEWQEARLGEELATTTWRQWYLDWEAEPGDHTIRVRATDGTGETQTPDEARPAPSGATGWDEITVSVDDA
jgi:DMSO/TMAO reductase YedYZ molybdopterin-dependent catalytic subunit